MSGLNNVRVKGIPVEIGGKTFYLKYDLNAFAALEDKYGTMEEVFKAIEGEDLKDKDGKVLMTKDKDGKDVPRKSFSFKLVRTILWAGLSSGDESLTEWQVGAMLEPSALEAIMERAAQAMEAALPKPPKEGAGAAKNSQGAST